jgi:hypothetical protein
MILPSTKGRCQIVHVLACNNIKKHTDQFNLRPLHLLKPVRSYFKHGIFHSDYERIIMIKVAAYKPIKCLVGQCNSKRDAVRFHVPTTKACIQKRHLISQWSHIFLPRKQSRNLFVDSQGMKGLIGLRRRTIVTGTRCLRVTSLAS